MRADDDDRSSVRAADLELISLTNIATLDRRDPDAGSDPKFPPTTVEEFKMLEEGEVLEGYLDGVHGLPISDPRSRSYHYGWTRGMTDRGSLPIDEAAQALRRAFERRR